MTAAAKTTHAPLPLGRWLLRGVALLAVLALCTFGAWKLGAATAPSTSAQDPSAAAQRAYAEASSASAQPAYDAAFAESFATGAEAGRVDGAAAATAPQ